jgi:tRNA(Arg) A34 adenosine deaminase TadA
LGLHASGVEAASVHGSVACFAVGAVMTRTSDYGAMRKVAIEEARQGRAEGRGISIGAALFTWSGYLLGAGSNRRVQEADPSVHAERMPSTKLAGSVAMGTP